MDEHLIKFLVGLIFIILAINTTMILDIASRSPDHTGAASQDVVETVTSPVIKTPTTTTAPVPSAQTRSPAPATTTIPQTSSPRQADNFITTYVTIEAPAAEVTAPREVLQPNIARQTYDNFITIYSINNKTLTEAFPNVSFNLVDPPLIIDYTVTPYNITDVKYVEYKQRSTYYKQNITVVRPYEDTWFNVIVRNKETGEIVAEDGFGKTRSMDPSNRIVVMTGGNLQFEFDGEFGFVNLTMKVNPVGNIH